MCGRCRQVFNAFQSLSRVEEPVEAHTADLQEAVAEDAQSAPNQPGDPIHDAPAASTATDTTTELAVDSLFLREEPLPLSNAFSVSGPLAQEPFPPAALLERFKPSPAYSALPDGHEPREISVSHLPAHDVPPVEPAIDLSHENNPLLVEVPASRGAPAATSSRGWGVGVFVLFVGLFAQASYVFRTTIVSNYPQLRPTVNRICEMAGCTLSWGRDEAALKIEASELIEAPGKPGRILLTAVLVNRGKTKQDMPSLELRLTDNANQVVVSRLLHPGDYLGRTIAKDEGLVPNTALYVNLNLELSNKPLASGYGLIVFYP